ncbi:uncharacterized protein LOC144075333 [Stigmatopora argus]
MLTGASRYNLPAPRAARLARRQTRGVDAKDGAGHARAGGRASPEKPPPPPHGTPYTFATASGARSNPAQSELSGLTKQKDVDQSASAVAPLLTELILPEVASYLGFFCARRRDEERESAVRVQRTIRLFLSRRWTHLKTDRFIPHFCPSKQSNNHGNLSKSSPWNHLGWKLQR